jgi:hypothetical protein
MGAIGHHARHVASAFLTGRQIVIGLAILVIAVICLIAPVVGGSAFDSFSARAEKAGKPMFLIGLGTVVIGLLSGAALLTGIGLCVIGVVVAGWLLINY